MYAKYKYNDKFNYFFLIKLHRKIIIIIIIITQQLGGLPIEMLKWAIGMKRLSTPDLHRSLLSSLRVYVERKNIQKTPYKLQVIWHKQWLLQLLEVTHKTYHVEGLIVFY